MPARRSGEELPAGVGGFHSKAAIRNAAAWIRAETSQDRPLKGGGGWGGSAIA